MCTRRPVRCATDSARRSSPRPYATLLFSGGQIISGPRQRRQRCALDAHSPRAARPVPEHYPSAPGSCTEEVASSRTYLEPPRRIKARPTGLRLQRSRRAATCSTWTRRALGSLLPLPPFSLHPAGGAGGCSRCLPSFLLAFWVSSM